MKLSRKPCRIIGVRVGEVAANLLAPGTPTLSVKFALLSNDGQSLGAFTKTDWSEKAVDAFRTLVEELEAEALDVLFDDKTELDVISEPASLSFPSIPTLGGPKRNNPP